MQKGRLLISLNTILLFCLSAILTNSNPAFCTQNDAQAIPTNLEEEIDAEFEWLREEAGVTFVITASRVKEDIRKSASSISVITEDQIRQMGAKHLIDALRVVPGMSTYYYAEGFYRIDARGNTKSMGQDILFMINSHPVNDSLMGSVWSQDMMILDNVKRIEVIRGPGSAMYGANAFSAVINVITKDAKEIDGGVLSAITGSYDTQQYNMLFGKVWNEIGISFNFNYLDTDGHETYIEDDIQNFLDSIFGTDTSLAPGYGKSPNEKYDISLELDYKELKFEGRYFETERKGPATPMYSVNTNSTHNPRNYYLYLSYQKKIIENLELHGKVYRNYSHYSPAFQGLANSPMLTPQGGTILSQEGMIAIPSIKAKHTGVEVQGNYLLTPFNTIIAGGLFEKIKQYDVTYMANFKYSPVPNVIIPLSETEDLTQSDNLSRNADRDFKAFFGQSLWDITKDLRLTIGARYDDYSDFGSSFNPRIGLTWEFLKGFHTKLLYGKAFRAPTFRELYFQNNPALLGNPDLKPERVETYEASLGFDTKSLQTRITGFYNSIKDNIRNTKQESGEFAFSNIDELRAQGFEFEIKYNFRENTYLSATYTLEDSENVDTGERPYSVPKHKGTIMANISLFDFLNWNTDLHFQDGFERTDGDSREEVSGFGIINTTLLIPNAFDGFEVRASAYNLLNKKYLSPSAAGSLPGDVPMPGRHYLFEVRYRF